MKIDSNSEIVRKIFNFYKENGEPIALRIQDQQHIMIIKYFQLLENIGGMSSITENKQHIGFIDVDNYDLKELVKKLKNTQKEFDISSWYVLESSKKNYHCICLDKHSFGFWVDVLKHFDNESTLQYQRFAINRGKYILRVTMKGNKPLPELITIIKRSNNNLKSNAHWKFLNIRYSIPKVSLLDIFTKIQFENYTTTTKHLPRGV